ncbi:16S rRNA (adenine(1518)-N(6)/adenine(1519)-N(6))-dimethyltransferase RsmA [Candidatus Tachikawaea gelatinosa]|uniref:Ribosomal RNA small subunit methyltransferase A n=1 Tax=Candidatus Tachikawaea gelatinosa TaxID=1410383 RepID=A0A090AR07_9ENTR|nr:16S rRNA (adenine(1518)-N(6)/adenine(1519)-N(6))-dimethyltransferase RsmA [Candidatus Tachikawaea gelatinosa]BAP58787.1 ribosomal RNA small subunit methyltransferase A [Candidatus Tachikawaea gelatinosa]
MKIFKTKKFHIFRKRYGQHFLKDKDIISAIINAINPQSEDIMVEIGPGNGALTKHVIKDVNLLIAIEIDNNLVILLKNIFLKHVNFIVFNADVIKFNFNNLTKQYKKKLRIFGNIPYNISTNLVFHLIKYIDLIKDVHFMFQKEVADRLLAIPNSKNYGKLTILAQSFFKITVVVDKIHSSAFLPQPKVNSIFLRFIPHKFYNFIKEDIFFLKKILTDAFNQRRKTIKNSLNKIFNVKKLETIGINCNLRAENLSVQQYFEITNFYLKNIKKSKIT